MGYVEKIMGDTERPVYQTHRHWIVLLERLIGWLLVFAVFLGLGLTVLTQRVDTAGNHVRWIVGLVILCSLVLPLFWIVRPWVRGERGRGLFKLIWRSILAAILILAVALLLMLRPDLWQMSALGFALALVPLYQLIRILLDWANERYIITNRRVMELHGIINKHVRDSALEKVNDVDMNQSFMGRILNYGTVEIITGSDVGVNTFHRIFSPVRFKRAMLNAKEALHQGSPGVAAEEGIGHMATPAPAAAPGAAEAVAAWAKSVTSGDIPDMIKDLDDLRQKGIISEEEFQAKKKDLLGRI
jgi:membrane protein YdbS with pleckstrin-like domain